MSVTESTGVLKACRRTPGLDSRDSCCNAGGGRHLSALPGRQKQNKCFFFCTSFYLYPHCPCDAGVYLRLFIAPRLCRASRLCGCYRCTRRPRRQIAGPYRCEKRRLNTNRKSCLSLVTWWKRKFRLTGAGIVWVDQEVIVHAPQWLLAYESIYSYTQRMSPWSGARWGSGLVQSMPIWSVRLSRRVTRAHGHLEWKYFLVL